MHIPDGFVSPGVAATAWVIAAAGVAAGLRAERKEQTPMPAGIVGSVAAFIFAAQMVNVPVAAGTSGHLVGATLAAVLLGPWRALLAMAAVLAVQALLFQDGGILAYGANLADMGLSGCFVGYAVARVVGRWVSGPRGAAAGAVLGAFVATVTGAVGVSIWLGTSGLYPLSGILPVMLVTHVAIGLLEAALTGAIVVTLLRWRPDLVAGFGLGMPERAPGVLVLGLCGAALAVAAFVAPLASTLPDGLQTTAESLGFASRAYALLPKLSVLAPTVAGVVGTLVAGVLAYAVGRGYATVDDDAHR
jgi:cobalt/nickel transport system permease protein